MATVSIDIAGIVVNFSLADADANRILAAYTGIYTTVDEDGNVIVPDTSTTVLKIADGVVKGLGDQTVLHEKNAASAAASNAVAPINAVIVP